MATGRRVGGDALAEKGLLGREVVWLSEVGRDEKEDRTLFKFEGSEPMSEDRSFAFLFLFERKRLRKDIVSLGEGAIEGEWEV